MASHQSGRIVATKIAVITAAVPILLYAYASGPDPRNTGAPGDQTCAQGGCHTGTAVNAGPGKVEVTFPSGLTYVPGTKQRLTVTITDAQQRVFGFQATARLESNLSATQAGTWSTTDSRTQVLCDDGRTRPAAGCGDRFPVEFIEHASVNATNTFTVEWTPPATAAGNVRIYVAGNAGNGNGQNTGDRVYTANYTLAPTTGGGGGPKPTISSGGVADGFNFVAGVAANTWTAIFGTDLATETKTWDADVQGNRLPTTVGGVSVNINNKPATVYFVSPGQINVLAPIDDATGDVQVVVKNANGESTPLTVRKAAVKPAFYAPFADSGKLYVTAVALDGTYVGKTGTDPRATRGARPGEVLLVFGTGFGATNPAATTDTTVTGAPAITTPVRIRFGETVANFAGTGNLVAAGLYQFNVTVPATLADGDYNLVAEQGGVTSSTNVFLTVRR